MTGYTTPDSLPYPNDYNAYADVPVDVQALANAVQTALIKRLTILPDGGAAVTPASGWAGSVGNVPTVLRYGELVVCRGYMERTAVLNVTDNGAYTLGTIPVGWRPPGMYSRHPAALQMRTSSNALSWTTAAVQIAPDGVMSVITNQAGKFNVADYVAFGSLVWATR